MATGVRAFEGESAASVITAILDREPPPLSLKQPAAPRVLDRLVKTCLAKDPDDRWQSAGDLMRELRWIVEEDSHPEVPAVPRRQRSLLPWALGALALGVLGTVAVWALLGTSRESEPIVRSVIATLPSGGPGTPISRVRDLAISPDGRRVVYGSGIQVGPLRMHSFDRFESEPLQGTDGGSSPVFSPDGGSVAFFDQREFALKRISILGGPTSTIATTDGLMTGLTWGPDDTIVFATERSAGLVRVPASGSGKPEQVTAIAKGEGEAEHRWPNVLPNGRGVLFTAWRGSVENSRIAVVSLDTREVTYLTLAGSHPLYAPTGHLVYATGGAVRAVGFDLARLVLTADTPVPVVDSVQVQGTGAAQFDLANNGSLVYIPQPSTAPALRTLVWVNREGGEAPLDLAPREYGHVRVSPDGSRIAVSIDEGGRGAIWVSNPAQTGLSRLPSPPPSSTGSAFQQWTPDGSRIVFQGDVGRIFWTLADWTGEVEPLLTIGGMVIIGPSGWTPDHQALLFSYGTGSNIRTGLLSMEGRGKTERPWKPIIDRDGKASGPMVSPNGGWVAYQSFDSGKYEVYIERFPELGERQLISGATGGSNPAWSPDGQELFYLRLGDGAMMAVRVQTVPKLMIGAPQMLFPNQGYFPIRTSGGGNRVWDVAPDGRFLMVKQAPGTQAVGDSSSFILVQNWHEELKRLVSTK
jgi:serine/threonine-protein kinase